MYDHLRTTDEEVLRCIGSEIARQQDDLELIASENYCSPAVMEAMGSPLTNKYAEGLPRRRYYGGCEYVDEVEMRANRSPATARRSGDYFESHQKLCKIA